MQLAAGAAVVTTSDGQHALALRVPAALLDPGTAGHWYIPCVGKELPLSVVAKLQQLDEYHVPAGARKVAAGPFSPSWCHAEWNLQLGLRREPIKGAHRYVALHHKDFHAIPRSLSLPAVYDKDTNRFTAIPAAGFPLRGYPLMGAAGSGHGMEVCLPPPALDRPPLMVRPLPPVARCVARHAARHAVLRALPACLSGAVPSASSSVVPSFSPSAASICSTLCSFVLVSICQATVPATAHATGSAASSATAVTITFSPALTNLAICPADLHSHLLPLPPQVGTIGSNPKNANGLFDNFFPLLSAEALLASYKGVVQELGKLDLGPAQLAVRPAPGYFEYYPNADLAARVVLQRLDADGGTFHTNASGRLLAGGARQRDASRGAQSAP